MTGAALIAIGVAAFAAARHFAAKQGTGLGGEVPLLIFAGACVVFGAGLAVLGI